VAVLFFSYAHADEALRDRLEVSLAMLRNSGVIQAWHDRRITAGDDFASTIDERMERADIILLLVSADFLASRYCYEIEMKRAMERQANGEARVIPVILRPCQWQDAPFGKLQAVPRDGVPVTKHANADEAFLEIANAIKAVVTKPSVSPTPEGTPPPSLPSTMLHASATVRSSNLRLKKTFTRADEDRFLDGAFEYMARFFEGSLAELQARNPQIETRFRRLNAETFTALAYREGTLAAFCRIFVSMVMGRGIAYSGDERSDGHSFNESLDVVHDDQMLGLRPSGFTSYALTGRTEFLTDEGAAEFYWARFMRGLQ
jgi:hypothetical protein